MLNFRGLARLTGLITGLMGLLQLPAALCSYIYQSFDFQAFIYSILICGVTSIVLILLSKGDDSDKIGKREGYLTVALTWIIFSVISTFPYTFSGVIPNFSDALFESVSGLTTTGATIITDLEKIPEGILLWRSFTQWIGGMGFIVLTIAIFPLFGIGGIELFVAETSVSTKDKLHPRIKETAKRLWLLYVGITLLVTILYYFLGMTFFDAINHALTTVSSGGFSTHNESMAAFNSDWIHYVCIFFMILSGVNFTLIYNSLKGNVHKLFWNVEFRTYIGLIFTYSLFVAGTIYHFSETTAQDALKSSLFHVSSIITTTGFTLSDYNSISPAVTFLFFALLFTGACAGSTSGGIKLIRHIVLFKHIKVELKRLLHPQAVIPLRINDYIVNPKSIYKIITFVLVYLMLVLGSVVLLSFHGIELETALGAVATSIGNVGHGMGEFGSVGNFNGLSDGLKVYLSFLMIIGRLEIFTILILFTPYFWREN